MAFSTAEVFQLFAEETDRSAVLDDVLITQWGRRFRRGRHEGHDIPKLPREVSCTGCRGEFCSWHALTNHLRQTACGGTGKAARRRAALGVRNDRRWRRR